MEQREVLVERARGATRVFPSGAQNFRIFFLHEFQVSFFFFSFLPLFFPLVKQAAESGDFGGMSSLGFRTDLFFFLGFRF